MYGKRERSMELGTHLEARFKIGTRLFARWRMPGLFALSVVTLAFLIWMHPQGVRTPFPWPTQLPAQSGPPGSGQGAGGTGGSAANAHIPAVPAFCLPTDISCIISRETERG